MGVLATRGMQLWDCRRLLLRRCGAGQLKNAGYFKDRKNDGGLDESFVSTHSCCRWRGEATTDVAGSAGRANAISIRPFTASPPIRLSQHGLLASTSNVEHGQHCFRVSFFARALHNESGPKEIGTGQPARETSQKKPKKGGRQETIERLQKVKWALYERRLPPELRDRDDIIKSEAELVGVVEQRIQQSMREGEFDKLPGHGKPLEVQRNPHVDAAEDLASRVLGNSGFAPEWVTLNKDIRHATSKWRAALKAAWLKQRGSSAQAAERSWEEARPRLEADLAEINRKILHYNLITPFGRQMMGRKMERELEWLRDELQTL